MIKIYFIFCLSLLTGVGSALGQSSACRARFSQVSWAERGFNPALLTRAQLAEVEQGVLGYYRSLAQQGKRLLIFTDASAQQTSGVITVMKILKDRVKALTGMDVVFVVPENFRIHTRRLDFQDLILAWPTKDEIEQFIRENNPAAIHLMVEGSIGLAVRRNLNWRGIPYTTAYHTDFPKYAAGYIQKLLGTRLFNPVVRWGVYGLLRNFHSTSSGIMVPTEQMANLLLQRGFPEDLIRYWSHGVDIARFSPSLRSDDTFKGLKRPISLYVGRIAEEKNLEEFLQMETPGTKVLVGGGPLIDIYKAKYPQALFLGRRDYEKELPALYASADIFVFPSLTETLGLVNYEALASGLPVLAYKVQGPMDTVRDPEVGTLVEYVAGDRPGNIKRLEEGWRRTIHLSRENARKYAEQNTWDQSIVEFLYFLAPLDTEDLSSTP